MSKLPVITIVPNFAAVDAIVGAGLTEVYYPMALANPELDASGNGHTLGPDPSDPNGFPASALGHGIFGAGHGGIANIHISGATDLPSGGLGDGTFWGLYSLDHDVSESASGDEHVLFQLSGGTSFLDADTRFRVTQRWNGRFSYFHTAAIPDPDVDLGTVGFRVPSGTPSNAFSVGAPLAGPFHLCVVREGLTLKLYLDGQLVSQVHTFVGTVAVGNARVAWGVTRGARRHKFYAAGVGYAPLALDAAQVAALYDACLPDTGLTSETVTWPGGTDIDHSGPKYSEQLDLVGGAPIPFTISNPSPGRAVYVYASTSDGSSISWDLSEVEVALDAFDPTKVNLITVMCSRLAPPRYAVKIQALDGGTVATAAATSYVPSGELTAVNVQAMGDQLEADKAALAILASTDNTEGADLIGVPDSPSTPEYNQTVLRGVLSEILGRGLTPTQVLPDEVILPNGADWPDQNPATIQDDSNNAGLRVIQFADPTVEVQSVGFFHHVAEDRVNYQLTFNVRMENVQGPSPRIGFRLRWRKIDNGTSPLGAWSTPTEFDTLDVPHNRWDRTGSGLNIGGGDPLGDHLYQFQLSRIAAASGNQSTGPVNISQIRLGDLGFR